MTLTKINFITGNKNKLTEVRAILGSVIEVDNQAVDVPEIQGTIEEIAKEKARRAAEAINGPALTEDTALEFNALKGLPGPYIKSFMESLGLEGLNKMLDGFEDRSAEAVCTFAFCRGPGEEPLIFQGRTAGTIVRPRGPTKFGWDPIFEYEGQTYAEMEKEAKVSAFLALYSVPLPVPALVWACRDIHEIKLLTPLGPVSFQNRISHRYKALVKFQQWLAEGQQ
ncbi:Inosine triphosphate pyrophosphatase [Penicillium subrubescens]|uniref:Inosine triphosphate pyrophosphatase n=1 Tax=Penicillium subrubescens TaxID=1316194 RepID=UPI00254568C7|nr:Inosine triphosphate pyrophosphatase [Penicillium subrubescens]KAJ5911018.1 Inosine triphosphate pyrophosphatase [Penicillium subrubescens]